MYCDGSKPCCDSTATDQADYLAGDLNIIIPAAPAAAALPPDEPVLSAAPLMLKVLEVNPDEADGEVDVGGVVDGIRPGCGWLGGTPGVNDAGVALFSPGFFSPGLFSAGLFSVVFLASPFGGPGGMTSGSSGKI